MADYRVLVVDDNHEIRRMVTASIKTLGESIDVLDVPSAEEALLISTSLPLDLVVLDFRLPGMTGLEMVSRLSQRKPGTRIILVTGVEDEAIRRQVAEAGAAAFFFKPIDINSFLDSVRRNLGLSQEVTNEPAVGPVASPAFITEVSPVVSPTISPEVHPAASPTPATNMPDPAAVLALEPTLNERLTALKKQIRATSVTFLNETGQVLAVVGSGLDMSANPAFLGGLMDAFRASQRITDALAKGATESLLCYTYEKQRVYFALAGPSHALLVVVAGYFEPDKLGMIDRAIHLAVHDLQAIVGGAQEAEESKGIEPEPDRTAVPSDVLIDQKTLADVASIFSKTGQEAGSEDADRFWELLGENGALDGTNAENVLSYDEARKMGLALDEDAEA